MDGPSIDTYRIVEKIGAGGMGVVYLAEDRQLRRPVVLKILSDELTQRPEYHERFVREARSAAALNHPNICTIYHVGQIEHALEVFGVPIRQGTPYIAMEHIDGHTLDVEIHGRGAFDEARLRDTALQITRGLAAAHDAGIVHRDLKPQNIMLTRSGTVKILDFGLAKSSKPVEWGADEDDETTVHLTREGTVVGTPAYMSPEQATGAAVDARSDVFALGVILNEMATGQRTFAGTTALSILAKVLESEPPPLHETRPQLAPGWSALVARCLRKDPAGRFRDASELLQALHALPATSATDAVDSQEPTQLAPVVEIERQTTDATGRAPRVRSRREIVALAALFTAAFAALAWLGNALIGGDGVRGATLVVLPFQNVGPSEHAYVAQGINEEITTRLATLPDLRMISRTSALHYAGSARSIRKIGMELDAHYAVEGSVQWQPSSGDPQQIRVTTRLVRTADERTVWSRSFDAPVADLFALQKNIADAIASELGVSSPGDDPSGAHADAPPTRNPRAYDLYLKGNDYASRPLEERDCFIALELYDKAVALDSSFALAWARASMMHSWIYWAGYEYADERLDAARVAANRALEIDPDLPEAQLALGYYQYRSRRDVEQAQETFQRVRRRLPNNSDLLQALAATQRRRGAFGEALENFERAADLDPRSHFKRWEVGETLRFLRRFAAADSAYDRALELAPDFAAAYESKAELRLLGQGDPAAARAVLEAAETRFEAGFLTRWVRITSFIFERDYDAALAQVTLETLDASTEQLFRLWIHSLRGDVEPMRAHADTLRALLLEDLAFDPTSAVTHSLLGVAYAALGDAEEALRMGTRAQQLRPISDDAIEGSEVLFQLAWTLTLVGDHTRAATLLESLCEVPSWITPARLRVDPTFDTTRKHATLRRLLGDPEL